MARELFGEKDPRYVVATANLGNLYRKLGNWARADELLHESLDLSRALLGDRHPIVGNGIGVLANLRLDQGQWDAALSLCDQALAIFEGAQNANPRSILASQTRRARALAAPYSRSSG